VANAPCTLLTRVDGYVFLMFSLSGLLQHGNLDISVIVIRRVPQATSPEHAPDGQQRHAVTVSACDTAHADTGQRRQRLRQVHVIVLTIPQTSKVAPAPEGHNSTIGGSQLTLRRMNSHVRITHRCQVPPHG
jgi:hypothetical protein